MRTLKQFCLPLFLTTATTTTLTRCWSSKLVSIRRKPKENTFFRRGNLEWGRTWISELPCPWRADPVLFLCFHSSNFLDCNKCYSSFPGSLTSVFLSTPLRADCVSSLFFWGGVQLVLTAPDACRTYLSSRPAPHSRSSSPRVLLLLAGQLLIPFLQRLPLDLGIVINSRQSGLLSCHWPMKGPQNKPWANKADAIHQNLIKILLYKYHWYADACNFLEIGIWNSM